MAKTADMTVCEEKQKTERQIIGPGGAGVAYMRRAASEGGDKNRRKDDKRPEIAETAISGRSFVGFDG